MSSSRLRFTPQLDIDACAIVKESIAPNEYIVPRKSVFPGRRTRIEMKPANTTSAIHGVLNFG